MAREFDVVVLGAGSTGENAAAYATVHGLSAAIVEDELVGGECSYWACMPSKALLRPGEARAAARRVPAAAAAVTGAVDREAAWSSRDGFASHWDDEPQVDWLAGAGVAAVRGRGRLSGERTVEVVDADGSVQTLTARRAVVIATGSQAAMPPVEGLDEVGAWTNREATAASWVPQRLLVLGGGVVGVELAQAYRRLGAGQVTIFETAERLLPGEERFAGEELAAAFDAEGIQVVTGATVRAARRDAATGTVTLSLADGREHSGDAVLVATGRRARTDELGLDTVGLEPGGFLDVDEWLRVRGVPGGWLYAAGDVNGRALLTHQGKYQARLVGELIAGTGQQAWADTTALPRVTFTDPQIAAVGRTESQARDAGLEVKTVGYDIGKVAGGALAGQGVTGTAQLVIDTRRHVVVGATFIGPGVGELLHAATIAIAGAVPLETLWHAVPVFPTMSEVWLRLLETERGTA